MMDARGTTINELLKTTNQFAIPVYQRNYDWQKEQCEQLFYDIEKVMQTGESHFLGTIVCVKGKSILSQKNMIIDGQQRITSIMLLIKALCDSFDEIFVKDAFEEYLFIKKLSNLGQIKEIKLIPIKKDLAIYEKILKADGIKESELTDNERRSNVYKNYLFFLHKIKNVINLYTIEQWANLLSLLDVVIITLDKENPQVIFESINSTGLDLTNTDLLRNYLLMPLEYSQQEHLYETLWRYIESSFESPAEMDVFMIGYLAFKKRSDDVTQKGHKSKLNNRNLYDVYKVLYGKETQYDQIEKRLQDIKKYAGYYQIMNQKNMTGKSDHIGMRFYEISQELEALPQMLPFLLYLYDQYKNNIFSEIQTIKILDIMISYVVRMKIHGNSIVRQYFALLIKKIDEFSPTENDFIEKVWTAVTDNKGTKRFPDDKMLIEDLCDKDLYENVKLCKYILYKMEREMNNEYPHNDKIEIEHILPQRPDAEYIKYLQENNEENIDTLNLYRNKIGNLTLVCDARNKELSNSIYPKKAAIYTDSSFQCTRELPKEYSVWTTKEIQERTVKMAYKATDVWKYEGPEIVQEYGTLNDTFNNFTWKKPTEIKMGTWTIKISSWQDMIHNVIKQLYYLDKDLFLDMLNDENTGKKLKSIIFEGNTYGDKEVIPFGNNLFMTRWMNDTTTILGRISIMVEYYSNAKDEYSGLFDSVEFKLK